MILSFDHDKIRELRLNRPPVNALTGELLSGLWQAIASTPGRSTGTDSFRTSRQILGWT